MDKELLMNVPSASKDLTKKIDSRSTWINIECKWPKKLPVKSAILELQKLISWTIINAPCILRLRRCIVAWRGVAWKFFSPDISSRDTKNYTKISPVNFALNYSQQRGPSRDTRTSNTCLSLSPKMILTIRQFMLHMTLHSLLHETSHWRSTALCRMIV